MTRRPGSGDASAPGVAGCGCSCDGVRAGEVDAALGGLFDQVLDGIERAKLEPDRQRLRLAGLRAAVAERLPVETGSTAKRHWVAALASIDRRVGSSDDRRAGDAVGSHVPLYETDNGAVLCGDHLGSMARATGRDISGDPIILLGAADLVALRRLLPEGPLCETCRAIARKPRRGGGA